MNVPPLPKMRTDPRIRQNLNHLSSTLESATDTARAGCFAFTKTYLEPLYESVSSCYTSCCTTCCSYIPNHDDSLSHHGPIHGRGRGNHHNSEFPFDFYNDDYWYDYDDGGRGPSGGFLAWGNDELDRLLAGSSTGHRSSPGMYYGGAGSSSANVHGGADIRSGALGLIGGRRKRHTGPVQHDGRGATDPTVIPSTSVFGFLGWFPWWGRSELRYRPSAADLQEHPGMPREFPNYNDEDDVDDVGDDESRQGLLSGSPRGNTSTAGPSRNPNHRAYQQYPPPRGRKRSHTNSSGTSGESFRSRGDLFPSDGEDDAVPLGDEFSIVLRGSGSGASDIDGETSMRGPRRGSVMSGMSSAPGPGSRRRSVMGDIHYQADDSGDDDDDDGQKTPRGHEPMDDYALRTQEEAVAEAEEREIERKRAQAKRLAIERGLSQDQTTFQVSHAYSRSPSRGPAHPPPRSRSSPPRSPRGQGHGVGIGMLSPMSLPSNSPRMMPYGHGPGQTGSPRMYPLHQAQPRSPTPRSPHLGPRSPTFHAARAAAAALVRPMSPISPLAQSPRAMSPEPVIRSTARIVQPTESISVSVVEPFVAPPPRPGVETVDEVEEDVQENVVEWVGRREQEINEQQEQPAGPVVHDSGVPSSILPHMRPSAQ